MVNTRPYNCAWATSGDITWRDGGAKTLLHLQITISIDNVELTHGVSYSRSFHHMYSMLSRDVRKSYERVRKRVLAQASARRLCARLSPAKFAPNHYLTSYGFSFITAS